MQVVAAGVQLLVCSQCQKAAVPLQTGCSVRGSWLAEAQAWRSLGDSRCHTQQHCAATLVNHNQHCSQARQCCQTGPVHSLMPKKFGWLLRRSWT